MPGYVSVFSEPNKLTVYGKGVSENKHGKYGLLEVPSDYLPDVQDGERIVIDSDTFEERWLCERINRTQFWIIAVKPYETLI